MVRHCRCGVRGLSTPSTEKAFPRAPPQDIDYDDGCFIPAALNGNFHVADWGIPQDACQSTLWSGKESRRPTGMDLRASYTWPMWSRHMAT